MGIDVTFDISALPRVKMRSHSPMGDVWIVEQGRGVRPVNGGPEEILKLMDKVRDVSGLKTAIITEGGQFYTNEKPQ